MQPLKELTLLMLSSVFRVPKGVIVPAKSTCSQTSTCHILLVELCLSTPSVAASKQHSGHGISDMPITQIRDAGCHRQY